MKKYYIAIALMAMMSACGNNNDKKEDKTVPATVSADNSSNPDYQKGLALIAGSDCLTCHKVSDKLTGPAYRDVANKYANTDENVSLLASKILKGGTGVWGSIPMTPHATLTEADAKQMVKYILLLRNK